MPRKARIDAPGALHHIIIRGIKRRKIFKDDTDRINFLDRLGKMFSETGRNISAWKATDKSQSKKPFLLLGGQGIGVNNGEYYPKAKYLAPSGQYERPLKNGNFYSSSRRAKISTTGIYGIFRGLKFEPDSEIGQKVPFRSLRLSAKVSMSIQRGERIASENGYSLMDE